MDLHYVDAVQERGQNVSLAYTGPNLKGFGEFIGLNGLTSGLVLQLLEDVDVLLGYAIVYQDSSYNIPTKLSNAFLESIKLTYKGAFHFNACSMIIRRVAI